MILSKFNTFKSGTHYTNKINVFRSSISFNLSQKYKGSRHYSEKQGTNGELNFDAGLGQWPVGVGLGASKLEELHKQCSKKDLHQAHKTPGYSGYHDVGGLEELLKESLPLENTTGPNFWEKRVHGTMLLLVGKGLVNVDMMRKGIEHLHPAHYHNWSYYEKWAVSISQALIAKNIFSETEFNKFIYGEDQCLDSSSIPRFSVGQTVWVKEENLLSRWRKPHLRTPGYIFGACGVIERNCGIHRDPEFLSFNISKVHGLKHDVESDDIGQSMYRVRFKQTELWPEYNETSHANDTVDVEIYESWLTMDKTLITSPPSRGSLQHLSTLTPNSTDPHHRHHHHHDHDHDHDHDHLNRRDTEITAIEREGPETPGRRVAEALHNILISKGIMTVEEVRKAVEAMDKLEAEPEGARLVARAWLDEEFKKRLLQNATAAAKELGINLTIHLTAVASTADIHNVIVCTLCSCYPISVLGPSPAWYKSRAYRAQCVRQPRKMLKESFGTSIPEDVSIRVHDSTADLRYMVVPDRPSGTENFTEEQLIALVTRDSMIGVERL